MQICQRNSGSVNTWLSSFLQRWFLYFHLCWFFAQMIKRTSCKIRWKSEEENFFIKKSQSKRKKSPFSFARHCCRAHGCGSLCNVVIVVVRCCCHSLQSPSITIRSSSVTVLLMSPFVTIHHNFIQRPLTSARYPTSIQPLPFVIIIFIDASYSSNCMYIIIHI